MNTLIQRAQRLMPGVKELETLLDLLPECGEYIDPFWRESLEYIQIEWSCRSMVPVETLLGFRGILNDPPFIYNLSGEISKETTQSWNNCIDSICKLAGIEIKIN